jgi:hydroxyethylthiazole kinase-like uncharacterized protein yjeF
LAYNLKKILSARQIQETDVYTIKHEPISSIELMERASNAFSSAIERRLSKTQKIIITCGIGNNGGDGLAVSRILMSKGYQVTPVLVKFSEHLSPDCLSNFKQLSAVHVIEKGSDIPEFSSYDVIVDAILGSGLTRPIEGLVAKVIAKINESNQPIFSIDIPSGLYCDQLSHSKCSIKSDLVITFQRPKLAFFFLENNDFIKEWLVVDIGWSEDFMQRQKTTNFILDQTIAKRVEVRSKYSHKGNYGHSLIISGSYGKMGAAVLASKACLRSGIGLLTTVVPPCGYYIMQATVPEAMCLTGGDGSCITALPNIDAFNAIGIGPGIGTTSETKEVLRQLFQKISNQYLVIDADGLNIISQNKELLNQLPIDSVLTPHPKEFERLVGKWKDSVERLKKQRQFSLDYRCILVLKGANTCITDQTGNAYWNTSGNPGMATGGSGDVLTGIITGLLGQKYAPLEAALLGVYFHGKAGDSAAALKGEYALIASDLIEQLRIEGDS